MRIKICRYKHENQEPQVIKTPATGLSLTNRELLIATFLASGESNVQIAQRLSVSPHTVAAHLGNMLNKVGARNRTELIARLYAAGVFKCGESLEPVPSKEGSSSDFDALNVLRRWGHPVDSLSNDHRAVLASLDAHDVRVLNAVKERLDVASQEAKAASDGDIKLL
jgi:DNA-binding CsgD family transcriptional regulator